MEDCNGNDKMPFKCRECGREFCSDHRLPENHNCLALSQFRNRTAGASFDDETEPNQNAISNASQATSSSRLSTIMLLLVGAMLIAGVVGVGASLNSGNGVPLVAGGDPAPANATPTATNTATDAGNQSGFWDSLTGEEDQLNATELERLVHQEMNEYRRNHSADTLAYDEELAVIAEYHSDNMAANGRIYHTSPNGETIEDRYQKFGYDCRVPVSGNEYTTGSENVLKTYYEVLLTGDRYFDTPEELAAGIVNQFVNSEPHRENLMNSDWRQEGIGINVTEEEGDTTVYVTQNFC